MARCPRFRNKPLVVVGGGDSAVEEATFLTKFASRVHMIHRRDQLRASKIMIDRAKNDPKLEIVWNSEVDEVLGNPKEASPAVRLKSTTDSKQTEVPATGMFLAIGHTPNTKFLEGKLELTAKKYIQWTVPFRTNTSVEGVFAGRRRRRRLLSPGDYGRRKRLHGGRSTPSAGSPGRNSAAVQLANSGAVFQGCRRPADGYDSCRSSP